MEGFLLRKIKDKSFGAGWLGDKGKTWQRQWFVLDDQTVTIYEDFDRVRKVPTKQITSFSVVGCEILPVSHKSKKFVFCIKHSETSNTLAFVQAEDPKMMGGVLVIIYFFSYTGKSRIGMYSSSVAALLCSLDQSSQFGSNW